MIAAATVVARTPVGRIYTAIRVPAGSTRHIVASSEFQDLAVN